MQALRRRAGRVAAQTTAAVFEDGRSPEHGRAGQLGRGRIGYGTRYSTVTDLARLRGLSTSVPLMTAAW